MSTARPPRLLAACSRCTRSTYACVMRRQERPHVLEAGRIEARAPARACACATRPSPALNAAVAKWRRSSVSATAVGREPLRRPCPCGRVLQVARYPMPSATSSLPGGRSTLPARELPLHLRLGRVRHLERADAEAVGAARLRVEARLGARDRDRQRRLDPRLRRRRPDRAAQRGPRGRVRARPSRRPRHGVRAPACRPGLARRVRHRLAPRLAPRPGRTPPRSERRERGRRRRARRDRRTPHAVDVAGRAARQRPVEGLLHEVAELDGAERARARGEARAGQRPAHHVLHPRCDHTAVSNRGAERASPWPKAVGQSTLGRICRPGRLAPWRRPDKAPPLRGRALDLALRHQHALGPANGTSAQYQQWRAGIRNMWADNMEGQPS